MGLFTLSFSPLGFAPTENQANAMAIVIFENDNGILEGGGRTKVTKIHLGSSIYLASFPFQSIDLHLLFLNETCCML